MAVMAASAFLATAAATATDNVTICHATGSESNPFVSVTLSAEGAYNGHIAHQDVEDIIPPFTYNNVTYSQNWDEEGRAAFNEGACAPDETTETPGPTTSGEIPVFPTSLALALGTVGALGGAFLVMRRRN